MPFDLSHSLFASATSDSVVAVKLGGACGGLRYFAGAIPDVVIFTFWAVQGGRELTVGRTWLKMAVNRDPRRALGARMSVMAMKKRETRMSRRSRGGNETARLQIYEISFVSEEGRVDT